MPGIDLNDPTSLNIDNAFSFEGSVRGEQLSTLTNIGDFNGDQEDDFLISGQTTSYLLFGPVTLDVVENVADYAEILIDHAALGRPATRFGDINGDDVADLAFVRQDGNDTW